MSARVRRNSGVRWNTRIRWRPSIGWWSVINRIARIADTVFIQILLKSVSYRRAVILIAADRVTIYIVLSVVWATVATVWYRVAVVVIQVVVACANIITIGNLITVRVSFQSVDDTVIVSISSRSCVLTRHTFLAYSYNTVTQPIAVGVRIVGVSSNGDFHSIINAVVIIVKVKINHTALKEQDADLLRTVCALRIKIPILIDRVSHRV